MTTGSSVHVCIGKLSPPQADSNAELMLYQRPAPVIGPTQTPCDVSPGEPYAETAVMVGATVPIGVGSPNGCKDFNNHFGRQMSMTYLRFSDRAFRTSSYTADARHYSATGICINCPVAGYGHADSAVFKACALFEIVVDLTRNIA